MKPAVVNASPLIILARAGHLDLLPRIFSPVMVPRGVADELRVGPEKDPIRAIFSDLKWLTVVDVAPALSPLATARLGRGESEVLEFARLHTGTIAILDDKAARRSATMLAIPITGTLGVLTAAADRGLLTNFEEAVASVVRAGLYIDSAIATEIARRLRAS